jgi:hypothetical protein
MKQKEFFWVGSETGEAFQTKDELQAALDDIRSIGWDIADYFYMNLSFTTAPSLYLAAPGAIKSNNGSVKEHRVSANDLKFDQLLEDLDKPLCGIFVYEVKPNPGDFKTIPDQTKVYYTNKYKYGSVIEIKGRSYFMSPSRSDLFNATVNPNNDKLVKEVLWIGNVDGAGFKSNDELRTAIYNIKSIGWDILNVNEAFFEVPEWNAYGVVKDRYADGYNKGISFLNKIRRLASPKEGTDATYKLNPNCGIYIYEVKPIQGLAETIPQNLTVCSTDQNKFSTIIDINKSKYFMIGTVPKEPSSKLEEEWINKKRETEVPKKSSQPENTKDITAEVEEIKRSVDNLYTYGLYLFYVFIAIIIILILYTFCSNYQLRNLISSKTRY